MTDDDLLGVLDEAARSVAAAIGVLDDWGLAGTRHGQYRSDLAADAAAVEVLARAGLGVLSEESGGRGLERDIVVVVDPVDGSTNAARGVPWYATSLCAVDADGPRAALVVNLATGARFDALRGGGARCDGEPLRRSGGPGLDEAIVAVSGLPPRHLGWDQFRCFGAAALDLCAVADGTVDAYLDCSFDAHGAWDYLGGMLVCREAGVVVADARGRDLVVVDHAARRTPVAAAGAALGDALLAVRAGW